MRKDFTGRQTGYNYFIITHSDLRFFCFSVNNTLYLEVHCPSVKPSLIVVSENGDNLVDFGKVPMGRTIELNYIVLFHGCITLSVKLGPPKSDQISYR